MGTWSKHFSRKVEGSSARVPIGFGTYVVITLLLLGGVLALVVKYWPSNQGAKTEHLAGGATVQRVENSVTNMREEAAEPGVQPDEGLVNDKFLAVRTAAEVEAERRREVEKAANEAERMRRSDLDAAVDELRQPPPPAPARKPRVVDDSSSAEDIGVSGVEEEGRQPLRLESIPDIKQNSNWFVPTATAPETPGSPTTPGNPSGSVSPKTRGFLTGQFLPRGHKIRAYLLDTVTTDDLPTFVTLAVAENVKFNGRTLIPFGTRMFANVGPAARKRLSLTVTLFQFTDGSEVALTGLVKGLDGATGIECYYIPPPTWVQLAPWVSDFTQAYLQILADRQRNTWAIKLGDTELGQQRTSIDVQAEAMESLSSVISTFADRQMTELQERFQAYLTSPAGTECYVVLQSPLDVTQAEIGLKAPQFDNLAGGSKDGPKTPEQILEALSAAGSGGLPSGLDPATLAVLQQLAAQQGK